MARVLSTSPQPQRRRAGLSRPCKDVHDACARARQPELSSSRSRFPFRWEDRGLFANAAPWFARGARRQIATDGRPNCFPSLEGGERWSRRPYHTARSAQTR
jgi:hypothetical protein